MQLQQPTVRLALLLRGLNRSSFEELPWQVGRKTVNAAAAAGLSGGRAWTGTEFAA